MEQKSGYTWQPIFDLSGRSITPSTDRRRIVLQLNDTLHLCIEKGDIQNARRAWNILIQCKEFDWKSMWRTALLLLDSSGNTSNNSSENLTEDFLKEMIANYPQDREYILQETVFHLAKAGKFKDALNELSLYLQSFPYQENPVLQLYAGFMSLKLSAQLAGEDTSRITMLRDAQTRFEKTLELDPDSTARPLLEETLRLLQSMHKTEDVLENISDDEMKVDETEGRQRSKRAKTYQL